ncbi:MAG: hypothetical protein H6936_14080 [Burkholderiales bacterium]|nr:hypothetical protein [Burkholderiales bacterium]
MFGSGTLGDCARQDFKLFEIEEVSVIVAYLCWKLERDGYNPTIEQALENYWLAREAELKKALRETK